MADTDRNGRGWSEEEMEARLVRYEDLRPCFNAFIDTRSPGSEAKENFTIIGPGVSENPDQYVHIAEPHGFNIGAARQPPGCVNSQHSHDTAEVFVVHTGRWRFDLGETGEDARIELEPGDVISIPTNIFRGFTNIGEENGLLWAVLGEDDPGRVTWAPAVFEMARDYGLVLLESGRLIDLTRGETIPDDMKPMTPTGPQDVARVRRVTPAEAQDFAWKACSSRAGEEVVIGPSGHFSWDHGFSMTRLELGADADIDCPAEDPKVVFLHRGELRIEWDGGMLVMKPGDTLSIPTGAVHRMRGVGDGSVAYLVRKAD